MRTAFIETLTELAREDPRLFLVVGDLGYSVVEGFARSHPERFLNSGVNEQAMTGIAAGLALCGRRVFTYSIGNFSTLRCLEQLRNDVAYHGLDVCAVAVGGGFAYGALGATHHLTEDLGVLRSLPEMRVCAPGDPLETREAVRLICAAKGPFYLRLGKAGEPVLHETAPRLEIGRVLRLREGRDGLLVSTGAMLGTALEAARLAEGRGLSVGVWSCPWLKPFDEEAVREAGRARPWIVTLEEGQRHGGLGSAAAEVLAQSGARARLRILAVPDRFVKVALGQAAARREFGLDPDSVAAELVRCAEATGRPVREPR